MVTLKFLHYVEFYVALLVVLLVSANCASQYVDAGEFVTNIWRAILVFGKRTIRDKKEKLTTDVY
jgi:hypothetical protein